MKRPALAATCGVLLAAPLFAQEDDLAVIRAYAERHVVPLAQEEVLAAAAREQTHRLAGLSRQDILDRDAEWRAQTDLETRPLIDAVLEHPAADFLRAHVDAAEGAITDIFLMDGHGLNVAATSVTSDYWQGDEAKFLETHEKGAGAMHVSEVDFDTSTQLYQADVSLPVIDRFGEVVGAITVGLNAEYLF